MNDLEIESFPYVETEISFWKRRWKLIVPLLVSLAGLVGIMAWGMVNQSSVTSQSGFTRTGKPAPSLNITGFSGEPISLADYKGAPVVVNFWASWCWPCRLEAPALEVAWRKFKDEGVIFLGVNIERIEGDAAQFLQEFDVTFPNGRDIGGLATIDYGVAGIPVTFFIDRNGIVVRRFVGGFVGAAREADLLAWTEELVKGRAPAGGSEGENLQDYFELDGQ